MSRGSEACIGSARGHPTVVYGFFAGRHHPALRSGSEAFTGDKIFEYFNPPRPVSRWASFVTYGLFAVRGRPSRSPETLRGAYGLGATKFDVSVKAVVPAALSV